MLGKGHFDPEEIKEGTPEQSKQGHQEIDESQYAIIETNESTQNDTHSLLIANKHLATKHNLDSHLGKTHQIYSTEDGLEAWKLVLDLSPELIICHVDLPTIDGLDLCKRLKLDERTGHIPVILIAENEIHDTMADFTIDRNFEYIHLESKVNLLIDQRNRIKQQLERHSILKPEVLTSYDETLLDNIVAYLDENLANVDVSVEKLSGEIGISRTHLYRKIKELVNMSPNQFIRTYRIRKAAQMLLQKKLNISDIRIRVGFSDADYFRSCFKKEYGMTPSAYIEAHKVNV